MNDFLRAATKGNKALLKATNTLGWDTTLATDEYSVWDATITAKNKTYLAETKHRKTKYDKMIMEDKKIYSIAKESKKLKKETGEDIGILYINTFDDGSALIWDIDKELISDCESKYMDCPITTSEYQQRVEKLVWLLPRNAAHSLEILTII